MPLRLKLRRLSLFMTQHRRAIKRLRLISLLTSNILISMVVTLNS